MSKQQIILYGAGVQGKKALDFLKYCNMDSCVLAFCDADSQKWGGQICGIEIISYEESKQYKVPYVITPIKDNFTQIEKILKGDNLPYYRDIESCLCREYGVSETEIRRNYCAFYHIDNMDEYFDAAESDSLIAIFWGDESPFRCMFDKMDLDNVIELACGHGRHVSHYCKRANNIILVDILEKNIDICKERFSDIHNIKYYKNNGKDLSEIEDDSVSALFTYDAMVHFEMFDIYNYLTETRRILKRGGMALFHHSNLMADANQSFENAPGGRNFMSKMLFAYLVNHAGLEVVEQRVIDWAGEKDMDCITLVRKA